MGSVGDELLVARLRADESRRWRRGASMASWAAPKWAQPRDRGTPRITKPGKGDAGNTPGRRRRRRRASSSTQSRRRPSRRRAGAASTRPRGAARPTARRAARRRRRRGAATAARPGSCAGGSPSRRDGVGTSDAAPYSTGNENGTAPRSAESAGRKQARTASTTTPSASFSGLAPPAAAPLAEVPFLGSVQL